MEPVLADPLETGDFHMESYQEEPVSVSVSHQPVPLWDPDFNCYQVVETGDGDGALLDLIQKPNRTYQEGRMAGDAQDQDGVDLPAHLKGLYEASRGKLTKEQGKRLGALLVRHQQAFSMHDQDLGRTGLEKHRIPNGSAKPRWLPPRRAPIHMREAVDRQVQEMLDQGIVEPCFSPLAAPLVLVQKKDGSTRICVDCRALNEVTEKDGYP